MCVALFLGTSKGVLAEPPAAAPEGTSGTSISADAQKTLPQEKFLSSVTESLRLGFDHDIVRGHFDLGTPPNLRRYYCLLDTRTGRREPNGVLGQPVRLPDGTTDLKVDSVSLYGCENAEARGMLVTGGYLLKTPTGVAAATPPQVRHPPTASPIAIDVAGVKLGMPLAAVRAVLKDKKLSEYRESTETLGYWDSAAKAMRSAANGRFVNTIATWTAPAAGDAYDAAGEAFEVMFSPVPGNERVMAIIHSVGYAPADAVREIALDDGLAKKYGGFAGSNDLPDSPTWRVQGGGTVQVGDPCGRRGLFGQLGALNLANVERENIALKRAPDEFRFEVDRCGVAIVTEDHRTANGGALRADRLVTRFTVTAYSPLIALEGAQSAAQLTDAAKGAHDKNDGSKAEDQPAPNL